MNRYFAHRSGFGGDVAYVEEFETGRFRYFTRNGSAWNMDHFGPNEVEDALERREWIQITPDCADALMLDRTATLVEIPRPRKPLFVVMRPLPA